MTDSTEQFPPTPPYSPHRVDTDEPKVPWWRKGVPVWAVVLIALVSLGAGGATAVSDGADAPDSDVGELEAEVGDLEGKLSERDERIESLEDDLADAVEQTDEATTTTGATTTTTTTEPPTTTTTAPPQPVEVARFSGGSTGTETQDFTVDGTWELQYSASGGAGLIVELIDSATGNRVDNISPDAGSGTSSFRQGGTYYLKVQTFGTDSWELVVVDVP